MNDRENEILSNIRKLLIDSLNPAKIILFGSRGKGNSGHGADFDFAIDMVTEPDKSKIFLLEEEIDKTAGLYKVDIVFLSDVDEEFKQIILETGKVIYEKRS